MTGTDGSLPDACTAALTNGAKWGIFLKAPVEGIEKGILWDTGAAMIWSGIEVVVTSLTRNLIRKVESNRRKALILLGLQGAPGMGS